MDSKASSSSVSLSSESFDDFNAKLQAKALTTTRNALSLPMDIAYHRSMDPDFAQDLDVFSSRVLSITNQLLALVGTAETAQSSRNKGKAKLQNQDDVVDNFQALVVDSVDYLLEKTDMCLDEFLGRTKPPAITVNPIAPSTKKTPSQRPVPRGHLDPALQHASHLPKPQLAFKRKIQNDDTPWYPNLSHKYNAQVPLGYNYHDPDDANNSDPVKNHPYLYEIKHLVYPERIFQSSLPIPSTSFEDTSHIWVSTSEALNSMLSELRKAGEIAVDLEHHSYRSYAGFVCLIQISTREQDWIIDTLELREELEELNEVFTNPQIIKVFHGADADVIWLQQNFNIYVVNLFDTFHASKLLEFPRHGLANLLEMYCDFIPDKRYQLADWRIRPLPDEMLQYARSDTHYLLYVYDNLRNALLDRGRSRAMQQQSSSPSNSPPYKPSDDPALDLLRQVLSRSKDTALKVYEKEYYDATCGTGPNGWDTLAKKWNKGALLAGGPGVGIGAVQREVYKAVHAWRERVARADDESTRYVLPNHFLFKLAEEPPVDMAALINMLRSVPPVVKKRAKELLDVIRCALKLHFANAPQQDVVPHQDKVVNRVEKPSQDASAEMKPLAAPAPPSLWQQTLIPRISDNAVASTSSLFGSTLSANTQPSTNPTGTDSKLLTPKSSLFGSTLRSAQLTASPHASRLTRFQELVTRIHSTLVIVPSVHKVPQHEVKRESAALDGEASMQAASSGTQVEIPFVPAAQRQTKAEPVDDTIITVGQKKQKKRKRNKEANSTNSIVVNEGSQAKKPRPDDAPNNNAEQEPFDFSKVPNILDDNPNLEPNERKKKPKKPKGDGMFYGDFPAPPKALSQPKSGNQSFTFKK